MLSAKREKGHWRLLFPEKTVHFLTEVSRGITPLQTIVYLTAQSKYTIRMYELLMRFRDTGKWYTTPEDLADLFELPITYRKNYGRLNQTILKPAKKELLELYKNNQSDIYFSYKEERGGRGNKVQHLIFSIFWREKKAEKEKQENTHLQFISDNLKRIMIDGVKITKHQKKKNEDFINKALSKLVETGNVKYFADKLEKRILQNTAIENDKKGALARYILTEDFGVE
jgi:plasmid replication initiation protein